MTTKLMLIATLTLTIFMTIGAVAALAAGGPPMLAMGQRGQAIDSLARDQHNAAPAPAVATIGSSSGHVFFAPEAHAPIATAAGFKLDFDAVNEHEEGQRRRGRRRVSPHGDFRNRRRPGNVGQACRDSVFA